MGAERGKIETTCPLKGAIEIKDSSFGQIFTCCGQRQPPVLDASDCGQMVCNTPNNRTLPSNNQDFETVIVIKVYMER
jgi:hypothetical protein